jgi:hypothetical protein
VGGLEFSLGPDFLSHSAAKKGELLDRAAARAIPSVRGDEAVPGPPHGVGAAMLFKNVLELPGKEMGQHPVHQGAFLIASSLRAAGVPVVWAEVRLSCWTTEDARRLAEQARGANFIGLTLYDSLFERARGLLAELRRTTDAFIAVGGLMPTLNPFETFVHLPEADFVVRGAGERIVPRLMAILGGRGRSQGLCESQTRALRGLDGVLFAAGDTFVWGGAEAAPRNENLDDAALDFGLLEAQNVSSGIQLCLSRGCRHGCFFCTSMDKGRFVGVGPRRFAAILGSYGRRLIELFGRWSHVPAAALGIGFYDDDFLADPARARVIMDILKRSPFYLRFIQSSIGSFFGTGARRRTIDSGLLDSMPSGLFEPKFGPAEDASSRRHVYIGTESFCDAELDRLGKGHSAAQVEVLSHELSRRRLRQAHHFIASNARTEPCDVAESLQRIVRLRAEGAPYFSVLEPVIPHLTSFYGTISYRGLERDGLIGQVHLRGKLSLTGYPEYDYPLVDRDEPLDPSVASFARGLEGRTGVDWEAQLKNWNAAGAVRSAS